MFIAMDPPKHDVQRTAVQPVVAPRNLASIEAMIRERTAKVLDELPRNETFDWVRAGVDRADDADAGDPVRLPLRGPPLLTYWSDVTTSVPEVDGIVESQEERLAELRRDARLLHAAVERARQRPSRGNDLISMLAHDPATRNMEPAWNISAT